MAVRQLSRVSVLAVGLWFASAACGSSEQGAPDRDTAGSAGSARGGSSSAGEGGSSGMPIDEQTAGTPSEDGGAEGNDEGRAGSANTGGGSGNVLQQAQYEACINYLIAGCTRLAECNGSRQVLSSCLQKTLPCPDFLFADGSTRTLQGIEACTEEHRHMSCALLPDGPSCATPGTRLPGAPCQFGTQCSSTVCRAQPGQCGVCATPALTGDPCADPNVECPSTDVCLEGVCTRAQARDPKPKLFDVGMECTDTAQCLFGLLCDAVTMTTGRGTCQPLPKPGQPCRYEPGAVRPSCAGACDQAGTCQPLPTLDQVCDPNYGCDETSLCSPQSDELPRCIARHAAGEPCLTTQLESERFVAFPSGMCRKGSYCGDCVTFDQGCKCVPWDLFNDVAACAP